MAKQKWKTLRCIVTTRVNDDRSERDFARAVDYLVSGEQRSWPANFNTTGFRLSMSKRKDENKSLSDVRELLEKTRKALLTYTMELNSKKASSDDS